MCPACAAGLVPAPAVAVEGLDLARALVAYDGPGRQLVRALKFANRRGALGVLAQALAGLVAPDDPPDAVTWVPAHPDRRRTRGYDQAELLARRAAPALGTRARRLLRRPRGPAQTGLDRPGRLAGPSLVAARRCPAHVLVVDDVITSGGSMAAAARALRASGARRVVGLAVAATPRRG